MPFPRSAFRLILLGAVLFACRAPLPAQNPDPGAAERYGWGFRNFGDTAFTWDVFSHAFFGVPLDSNDAWLTSSFDKLFYEVGIHKKLPNPDNDNVGAGNCYGISLLSLMVNKFGGYDGFCAPTSAYRGDTAWSNPKGPNDLMLHREVDIMHARQLSLGAVESDIDQVMTGHAEHSNNAVTLAQQAIGKEGPCIVALMPTANPFGSGGHAMIAYGVTDDGASHAKIWIVDPNRLWAVVSPRDRGWYQKDSNYIYCDLSTGSWSFLMKDSTVWPTDGAGILAIVPLSVVGPPGRVPSSLGFSVGELLGKVFLTDRAAGNDADEFLKHRPLPPERGTLCPAVSRQSP